MNVYYTSWSVRTDPLSYREKCCAATKGHKIKENKQDKNSITSHLHYICNMFIVHSNTRSDLHTRYNITTMQHTTEWYVHHDYEYNFLLFLILL